MTDVEHVVALAGDWHGNFPWARARLMSLGERGVRTVFHTGDFGIWPGPLGKKYIRGLEKFCARCGITVYVTAGNHEDWPRLLAKRPEQRNDLGSLLWLADHVAVFPRDPAGHRFEMGGRTFLSLGGAPSVDFEDRSRGRDWWPEEMIPRETAERVSADGYADVMLTHDAPDHPWQTPRVAHVCATNPLGWSRDALAYAAVGRHRLITVFLGVQPRVLAHGHYHLGDEALVDLPDRDHGCRVFSLACDGMADNMALLDLRTLERSAGR